MHENLSKLRKSRIPLYKTQIQAKQNITLRDMYISNTTEKQKMTIKEQVPFLF